MCVLAFGRGSCDTQRRRPGTLLSESICFFEDDDQNPYEFVCFFTDDDDRVSDAILFENPFLKKKNIFNIWRCLICFVVYSFLFWDPHLTDHTHNIISGEPELRIQIVAPKLASGLFRFLRVEQSPSGTFPTGF